MTLHHLQETIASKSPDETMTVSEIEELLSLPPERKGGSTKGEAHHSAKLTADDVRNIRRVAATGVRGWRKDLAIQYGVNIRTIQRIVHREKWKHID